LVDVITLKQIKKVPCHQTQRTQHSILLTA
jgi:hypothetical protein